MIKGINIHKSYGSLNVLKGINIEIHEGEVVSIVGASGAGKSTLLHLLGTLDKVDSGSIEINNEQVNNFTDKKLSDFRNHNIGFIFQFHHLLPEFTAIENVCIPAFIAKKSKKEAEARAIELIDFLGLSDRIHYKPAQLSGGEQQRLAVARALINSPKVILADEPSGNLDSENARELHKLFFSLRDKFNQTFLIVTHNEELAHMADRKLTIKDGIIIN
ncbi:MAG TPA: ABC transporter ATP-binding protein [Bacteroidales bacterium]|nr:ABC transporter ATP-binding protein [Bacteroidales bacterium]